MEEQSRYLVGIDLGTTNSAIAFVDTQAESSFKAVHPFPILQIASKGFVQPRSTLPSFCYQILEGEWSAGEIKLPWNGSSSYMVGEMAREQGALVPTRLVASAKSWLCNASADRLDRILPPTAEISQRISPVEATRRYLAHMRDAWNHTIARGDHQAEFEQQEIVLTVPASFDEVARTLTAQAAKEAGLTRVTLLEEPQAAFYEWIRAHEDKWTELLLVGDLILVCDVGGGTTDFSLIEVIEQQGVKGFRRLAVGDHLLLGGDNMDVFLAYHIAERFKQMGCDELSPIQWLQVRHEARCAKEVLLAENAEQTHYTVRLQAAGSRVVGGSLSLDLAKNEVQTLLTEGFFALYKRDEATNLKKRSGMRSMGLPYEEDPSITKHLAHFLFQQHGSARDRSPDYVLFNGGAMKPALFQRAIVDSMEHWYGGNRPQILVTQSLDLSVSRGAAYYGKARRGWGVRIGGGTARSYYLKVDVKEGDHAVSARALTLLPRGSDEGASFESDQTFYLFPNRPVSFQLLSSHVRLDDKQGDLLSILEEEMQALPPLHTVIRFGKNTASDGERIPVHLGITLTPLGTLSLWLRSSKTPHRWNLEFQVRKATGQEDSLAALDKARNDETHDSAFVENAKGLIQAVFEGEVDVAPGKIMEQLEHALQSPRGDWPPSTLRALADVVLDLAEKRKRSPILQRRWWNLVGFLLRPGCGFPLDDFRLQKVWKCVLMDLKGSGDLETDIQRNIALRRLAGGFSKGQQMQIASALLASTTGKSTKGRALKGVDLYHYVESMRALAALERIEARIKQRVAEILLERIQRAEAVEAEYWALGRLGSRQLLFGSLAHLVPISYCVEWIQKLMALRQPNLHWMAFPLGHMARRVDHPEVNVPQSITDSVRKLYDSSQLAQRMDKLLQQHAYSDQTQQEELFGESLPSGLLLEL